MSDQSRHGIALLLVMTLIAAATIVSWAMLNSAALRAKMDNTAVLAVEADYLAESGLSLAVYYLDNPDKSPVPLIVSGFGQSHYPGQAGLYLWPDASLPVDIVVIHESAETFRVLSSVTLPTTGGGTVKRVAEGKVRAVAPEPIYEAQSAFIANKAVMFNDNHEVQGGVQVSANVSNTSSKVNNNEIQSTNGASLGGSTLTDNLVPAPSSVRFLQAAKDYGPTDPRSLEYEYQGQIYRAQLLTLPLVIGSLQTTNTATNPANVWVSNTSTVIRNLSNFTGTIVVRGSASSVVFQGVNDLQAHDQMPVLIVEDELQTTQTLLQPVVEAKLKGLVYVGDEIDSIALAAVTPSNNKVDIKGALLVYGKDGGTLDEYDGWLKADYDDAVEQTRSLVLPGHGNGEREIELLYWRLYTQQ